MSTALAPVQNKERIWLMDALRGFAILGIFIANLGTGFSFYVPDAPHAGPYFSPYDDTMFFLHHVFLEGKFYSIFSFLFGWGIALQLSRSVDEGLPFVKRRLFIMLLLGLAHIVFLWIGDIVAFYAMVGFLLLPMRRWKDRTLLITAIILILSPILLYALKMWWPPFATPTFLLFQAGGFVDSQLMGNNIDSQEEFMAFAKHASYTELVKTNISGFFFRYGDLFFQSRIPKVLGMFVLGYLMGRNGRYKTILDHTRLLWTIAIAGLLIGLPANYLLANYMKNGGDYYNLTPKGLYRTIVYALGVAPLALAYMALFFLAARGSVGKRILAAFSPVGKMAFSNYIFQSLVGTLIFTGVGWGYIGEVGPVYFTVLGIVVFGVQMVISAIWLRYFEYGPVEWLWRSATYGKRQDIRKKAPITLVVSQENAPTRHQDPVH